MVNNLKKYFLILLFLFSNFVFAGAFDIQSKINIVVDCANSVKAIVLDDSKIDEFISRSYSDLDEEYVLDICEYILKKHPQCLALSQKNALSSLRAAIVTYLKGFIVVSYDIDIDPNVAFLIDHQTPHMVVHYRNHEGLGKKRKYAIKVWSVGLKIEFAIRIELIKITSSLFNYYDTNKIIKLGKGIEVTSVFGSGFTVLYCGIKDFDGGLLISGFPLGFSMGFSIVTGGSLVPVAA